MGFIRGRGLALFTVGVFVLAGVCAVAIFSLVGSIVRAQSIETFSDQAKSEFRTVEVVLDQASTALGSTASLFAIKDSVSREDFEALAGTQLEASAAMRALEWIPRVPASERLAYELAAQQDGFSGFSFTARDTDGQLVPASDGSEYYPVFFVEPYVGNEAAMGFDLKSNNVRLVALRKARDTGRLVVTERVTLVEEAGEGFGFLGFIPVYDEGSTPSNITERRERLRGFVLGVFRAVDLVDRPSLPHDPGLHIALIDVSAPESRRVLYAEQPLEDFASTRSEYLHTKEVSIGGRDWSVLIMPSSDLTSIEAAWKPRVAATAVFFLVLLTGLPVVQLLRRHDQVRAAVNERTAELRIARDELRLTSQQNQAILDGAGAGIISMDANQRVTLVNPAATAILKIPDSQPIVGLTLEELDRTIRGVDSPYPADVWLVKEALLAGATVELPLAYASCKDGTRVPIEAIGSPLHDEKGRVVGAVSIFRDVSESVRIDRAQTEFIAMTGHELRTPLTAIHAALGLVVSGVLGEIPEPMRASLDNAARNSDRLIKLVADILALETMTLGVGDFELAPTQALDVVHDVVDLSSPLIREHGNRVVVRGDGFLAELDDSRMNQALTNLLQNALKFSPPESAITMAAYAAGDQGIFEITDEGPGIPAEKRDDIFVKFEQVDSSDTRLYGGVGLGLAITKAIAERHGGEVWVADTGDTGTTFKLAVPLLPAA
jgi:PAS domain S-box-containing protein